VETAEQDDIMLAIAIADFAIYVAHSGAPDYAKLFAALDEMEFPARNPVSDWAQVPMGSDWVKSKFLSCLLNLRRNPDVYEGFLSPALAQVWYRLKGMMTPAGDTGRGEV
jgi:hypothetical protein